MDRRSVIMVVVGLAVLAAVIVGVIRSATGPGGDAEIPVETPGATSTSTVTPAASASSSGLEEHDGHDHDDDEPTYTPTNDPSGGGTDHDHESDTVPKDQEKPVLAQNTAFWKAFSIRDPKARDKALAKVAVPYLAQKMSVSTTARIPVVEPAQVAIVHGSFSSAYVVTEASTGEWWYVNYVYDPANDSWGAQVYEPATGQMIADARRVLAEEKR